MPASVFVIPAKAGIQKSQAYNNVRVGKESWIPACAGITANMTTHPRNPNSRNGAIYQ